MAGQRRTTLPRHSAVNRTRGESRIQLSGGFVTCPALLSTWPPRRVGNGRQSAKSNLGLRPCPRSQCGGHAIPYTTERAYNGPLSCLTEDNLNKPNCPPNVTSVSSEINRRTFFRGRSIDKMFWIMHSTSL